MHDFQLGVLAQASLATKNCLCPPASLSYFNPEAVLGHGLLHLNELIKWNSIRIKIISPRLFKSTKDKAYKNKGPDLWRGKLLLCSGPTWSSEEWKHLAIRVAQNKYLGQANHVDSAPDSATKACRYGMTVPHWGIVRKKSVGFQTERLNFFKK